ncbi:MAG: hypothetical protein QHH05_06455 [Syntrophomonadaceae bacterium]|nr:hypothetical protein [Syntrophomonadaceae bacterium]
MAEKKTMGPAELGIDLESGSERELFRWFLACLLFGKPIQQQVAKRAYLELVAAGLDSPQAILAAGWDRLVQVLDRGHYVRYDFSTASKLLEVCAELTARFGTLTALVCGARDAEELSATLQRFKGIGPVTAAIFLREVDPQQWCRRAGHR